MVARNRARDVLRKRAKLGRHPSEDNPDFEQQDDSVPVPSGALEQGEREKTIKLLLASLPEQWRAAVTLRYLEGMDHSSIEQELGLSNGALRGILGRAMGRLRSEARQHMGDFNN
jgi:RNA polymerase sigma factor (sigma-70 family)